MPAKHSPEVKTKAVRLVREHREDYPSEGREHHGAQVAGDER